MSGQDLGTHGLGPVWLPRHVQRAAALNIAAHGAPVYTGRSLLVWRAEEALLARIEQAAIVTWNDARGHGKREAAKLLRDTAASVRGVAAK
ncbi:DUF6197 family protein [Streptomyces sp. 351MFTsu5.1]|uniref:DUF6197 family protein n=1 Tax=Streptomyces sp. 351MFTsu5.1 TaxID=1172180 RepID=UPI00037C27F0|nr:hypothetical protein [Streptomyces sp. 351MFTsu5.1]